MIIVYKSCFRLEEFYLYVIYQDREDGKFLNEFVRRTESVPLIMIFDQ